MNNKEKYLCTAGLALMFISTVIGIIVRTNEPPHLAFIWKLVLIVTDVCWWLTAKEHFKDVKDDFFSFQTEVLQKEVFETVPLALAGGIIGTLVL